MAVCIVHSNWRQLPVEAESSVKRLGRPKSQQRLVVLCWRAVIQALPEWKLQHSARGSSSVMLPWCERSWLLLIEKYLLKSWCHEQHWYEVFEGSADNWGGKCLLCTTWNKASWMCGWPPKRRGACIAKECISLPFYSFGTQVCEHGLLVLLTIAKYTPQDIQCVLWYHMPMESPSLGVDDHVATSDASAFQGKDSEFLCSKVPPSSACCRVPVEVFAQFHKGRRQNGWWSARTWLVNT